MRIDYIFFIPIFFPEMGFDVRLWSFLIFILFVMLTFVFFFYIILIVCGILPLPIDICRYASVKMHGPCPVIAYVCNCFYPCFSFDSGMYKICRPNLGESIRCLEIPTRISPDFFISFSAGLLVNTCTIQGDVSSRTKRKIQKTFSSRESS